MHESAVDMAAKCGGKTAEPQQLRRSLPQPYGCLAKLLQHMPVFTVAFKQTARIQFRMRAVDGSSKKENPIPALATKPDQTRNLASGSGAHCAP